MHIHIYSLCSLRYGKKHPHFYIGSLENAVEEVTKGMENPEEVRLDNIIIIYVINFTREIVHVFVMSPESYLMGGGEGASTPLSSPNQREREGKERIEGGWGKRREVCTC